MSHGVDSSSDSMRLFPRLGTRIEGPLFNRFNHVWDFHEFLAGTDWNVF